MFWLIWLERNNKTFQNKTDMTEGIATKARANVTVRATHNDFCWNSASDLRRCWSEWYAIPFLGEDVFSPLK